MKLPYNPEDKSSIILYAQKLKNKTLREVCDWKLLQKVLKGKGSFGQTVEKAYFLYDLNSNSEPDFPFVGLELKSSPLKQLKNNEYRSKERLVLNIINYSEIVSQDFTNSSFWKKNANLLLIFYIYQPKTEMYDYEIKLVDEWSFPDIDLEIIKKDWEIIQEKVKNGKAHELSEGDTFYLGACTKGANADSTRPQPYSTIMAKQRAFSLKQGYVNHIIASIAKEEIDIFGKLITTPIMARRKTIEEIVISKFTPYYGKTAEEILNERGLRLNQQSKSFYATLTKAILGIESDKEIEEFEKAEIIVKTVRLKENGLPKEDISFPTFKYEEIVNEEWEDSAFKDILEHKFMFVFFQYSENGLVLKEARFWNMPFNDREAAKIVWEETKAIVAAGEIVKEIRNGVRFTNFPNKQFSSVSHVRPHAANAQDSYPLPVKDKLTGFESYTKHCFWLNSQYIKDEIYSK